MGMGLAGLGTASGAAQGLQEILAQRLRERQMALQEQNSAQGQGRWEQEFGFRQAESEREAQERAVAQAIQLEILRGNQQNRDYLQADRTADNLAIGDRFGSGAPQINTLERGGLGNLMKAIPMSPDQAMPRMKIGAPDQMGAKPITAEYAPGEYEYQGTGAQRNALASQQRSDQQLELSRQSGERQAQRLEAFLRTSGQGGDRNSWFSGGIRQMPDGTWGQVFYSRTSPGEIPKVITVPFDEGSRPKPTEGGLQKENNSILGLATISKLDEMASRPDFADAILRRAVPGSPFARMYDALGSELGDLIARLRTGAQINETEMDLYSNKFLPNAADIVLDDPEGTKQVIAFKIGKFRALFRRLARAGGLNDKQVQEAVSAARSDMDSLPAGESGGQSGRIRVKAPDGSTGTFPAGQPLPPGYTVVK